MRGAGFVLRKKYQTPSISGLSWLATTTFGAHRGTAGAGRTNLLAADHFGAFVLVSACMDVLVAGLNALNALAGFDSLSALVGLDALQAFVRLDALKAFAPLETLRALNTLDCFGALDALDVLAAQISELLLQLHVFELNVAVVRRVEFPVLELATAADIDLIEFAVQHGVGLDRRKPAVSPIVMGPQRRTDKERRAESEDWPNRPPGRMPKEGDISRCPVAGTVDNDRIVNRHVNVIRLRRLDHDVLGRSRIAGTWRRHPPDLLLLARFQVAGHFGLLAQSLNCILYVVGLGEKGLAKLVGPVQLFVHHRQHLRHRRQPLDARVPRLLLHGVLER